MTAYDRWKTAYPPHWDRPEPAIIGYRIVWFDGRLSEDFEPGIIADKGEAEARARLLDAEWLKVCAEEGCGGRICALAVYEGER